MHYKIRNCSSFGDAVKFAAHGSILACGGRKAAHGTGRLRTFKLTESDDKNSNSSSATLAWVPLGQPLTGTAQGDDLGKSLSLNKDGTRLAVGASQNHTGIGYVLLVYDSENNVWNQAGQDLTGLKTKSKFGYSNQLSAKGNVLVVGAAAASTGQVLILDVRNL